MVVNSALENQIIQEILNDFGHVLLNVDANSFLTNATNITYDYFDLINLNLNRFPIDTYG